MGEDMTQNAAGGELASGYCGVASGWCLWAGGRMAVGVKATFFLVFVSEWTDWSP